MSGATRRGGTSMVFTDEATHSGSREMDEVARSWPQLMALLGQLMRHIHTATGDGSMKLSRRQWREMVTEAREIQKQYEHHADITRQWYNARVAEYHREAVAASIRVTGSSVEERARDARYLAGLRAGIEHTIHNTPLTDVERGQVVHTLDRIDAFPIEPIPHTMFTTPDRTAAAQARQTAAVSERCWLEHRDQLDATSNTAMRERPAVGESAGSQQFTREATQRLGELAERIERLEQQMKTFTVRETATATPQSNGHVATRHEAEQARHTQTQTAEHDAAEHETAQWPARAQPHTAHPDVTAGQDGQTAEHPQTSPAATAEHIQAMSDVQVAEYVAEMEAEA